MKIYETQRQPCDEFTKWCEDALTKFQAGIDGELSLLISPIRLLMHLLSSLLFTQSLLFPITVPTFVGFLKDLESPYDVNDYIKSYLGEGKESREFAKLFLEKRSYYRNLTKHKQQEQVCFIFFPSFIYSILPV